MRVFEPTGHFDLPRGSQADYYDYHFTSMDDEGSYEHYRPSGKQFPMQHITQPHHNDVLMGRGGKKK
jgi:hypothetical protein